MGKPVLWVVQNEGRMLCHASIKLLPIPSNVDQDLLLKMIQGHGILLEVELAGSKCALVVPQQLGQR